MKKEVQNDSHKLNFWIPQMKLNTIENHHKNHIFQLQPDQINMAVLFWYRVRSDASDATYTVAFIGQVTF